MLIFFVGFLVGLLVFWPLVLIGLMVWGGYELRAVDRDEQWTARAR